MLSLHTYNQSSRRCSRGCLIILIIAMTTVSMLTEVLTIKCGCWLLCWLWVWRCWWWAFVGRWFKRGLDAPYPHQRETGTPPGRELPGGKYSKKQYENSYFWVIFGPFQSILAHKYFSSVSILQNVAQTTVLCSMNIVHIKRQNFEDASGQIFWLHHNDLHHHDHHDHHDHHHDHHDHHHHHHHGGITWTPPQSAKRGRPRSPASNPSSDRGVDFASKLDRGV